MVVNRLKQILSGEFIRNVGWLGGAELVNRIFRLGTTVTLARTFSTEDYGLTAVIYTIYEFATVFTLRHGIGAKIIQTKEEDVKTVSDTSYWLNWILCISIFVIQCLAAFPIAYFYNNSNLVLPLCTIALVYIMFPLFLVNSALVERENRLKVTAICNATQALISNIIIVTFALLGMGVWAIVWAMLLSTPVWIIINWRNHPWRPPKHLTFKQWQEIVKFGKDLIGIDLLNKLRMHLDYLIVGKFLGINELGLYYFAFNAGSGITMNISYNFTLALYPHICAVRNNYEYLKERYFKSVKTIATFIVSLVILQSVLAPIYVPIIFGQKWTAAIPVLILVCLSVIPRTFKDASSMLLNAVDKTRITLSYDVIYTVIFIAFLLISVRWGIFWLSLTALMIHILLSVIFNILAIKLVFSRFTLLPNFYKKLKL
ncbi:lipopolysaccharide biosynthesis protein [Gloeocapsopsis sp. IPPAS B-1203]|uniref:lipopolysaccharide biosynthesis protein n=1 Tax=Gloeocapsopsis sp. IPPAS B-1203 TaxID=2049454 RepID=UPI000C19A8E4|nr:lipopolysaccharide biosynthesis protein [Gloeocapsopsis sp. IPPAS B-1203]PIG94120.1 lipopolysaccharide biosynthesis protein [Gloeocapsopsis sp. IPPAS B-1203]